MSVPRRASGAALGLLLFQPAAAFAGMPTVTLTDASRLRVQTISFFLLGFFLSSWLIQLLWNGLRKDFARLPRLSYGKALGLVTLWGLLFVLVLTMISGARELMTPGAWEKQGSTYRLKQPPEDVSAVEPTERQRENKLLRLRTALREYARQHGGKYPADRAGTGIAAEDWRLPGPSGVDYAYVGGLAADGGPVPLAYEPGLFGPRRMVLLADGEIRRMEIDEILKARVGGKP